MENPGPVLNLTLKPTPHLSICLPAPFHHPLMRTGQSLSSEPAQLESHMLVQGPCACSDPSLHMYPTHSHTCSHILSLTLIHTFSLTHWIYTYLHSYSEFKHTPKLFSHTFIHPQTQSHTQTLLIDFHIHTFTQPYFHTCSQPHTVTQM